ncbi:MAG: hypothetical protein Q8S84_05065 [bacterium]|nr:hypothetical protein [bacterium]MDP3380865.1 hypothetical protein [bacterium]
MYQNINNTSEASNKNNNPIFQIIKSEDIINNLVDIGNSTSAVSNNGLICGITKVSTTNNAKNKNKNIIIG